MYKAVFQQAIFVFAADDAVCDATQAATTSTANGAFRNTAGNLARATASCPANKLQVCTRFWPGALCQLQTPVLPIASCQLSSWLQAERLYAACCLHVQYHTACWECCSCSNSAAAAAYAALLPLSHCNRPSLVLPLLPW